MSATSDRPAQRRVTDPEQVKDLEASGIAPSTWAAAGLYTEADPQRVAALLGWKGRAEKLGPCLVFPYRTPDGADTGYARLKPARPVRRKPGEDAPKYEAPKARPGQPGGNRAYFPPGLGDALRAAGPLVITEGEKKALCATQYGFPAIALSGVWNCVNRGKVLIPDLAAVAWHGRPVYIAFDSDRLTNENVRTAEAWLAAELKGRGADVRLVGLPPGPGGEKTGLDDFFARGGTADQFRELLARAAPPADPARVPTAGELALRILGAADLWHDDDTAYVTTDRGTFPVRSKSFRLWFTRRFFDETRGAKAPPAEQIASAENTAEAAALMDRPQQTAYVRVGQADGAAFLHLADERNSVVAVDAGGWRVLEAAPVRLVTRPGMRPLPAPRPGGSLEDLRRFVNVRTDADFALLKAWVAACFWARGPFPVLVVGGEQGSTKSTATRVLKWLIDPNQADLRKEPKESRDLMVMARAGWVMAFDNLSGLPAWFADDLCRLSTGGGLSVRQNYTDADETIFSAKRPVVLNGIGDFVTRADLLERAVLLRLERPARRRTEREFEADFRAALPRLLGAVLDYVAGGLRELPRVALAELPRMADFAEWAVACERGAGGTGREFLEAYAANLSAAHVQALEGNPVPELLAQLAADGWPGGTVTELLDALTGLLPRTGKGDPDRPAKWPKAANQLSAMLNRLGPSLRDAYGLDVRTGQPIGRGNDKRNGITVTLLPPGSRETSAPSTPSTPGLENTAFPPVGPSPVRPTPAPPADPPHVNGADAGVGAGADASGGGKPTKSRRGANGADGAGGSGPTVPRPDQPITIRRVCGGILEMELLPAGAPIPPDAVAWQQRVGPWNPGPAHALYANGVGDH